ncbi:hypothetical protein SAMN05216338_102435 [Bradyrhizobium sp. Rc2d]|nr:hypothetical protein SAMN05216338_102435 [Bradyrhizobium sp. Rc2d]
MEILDGISDTHLVSITGTFTGCERCRPAPGGLLLGSPRWIGNPACAPIERTS